MKTPLFSSVVRILLFCPVLLIACRHEQVKQFSVDLHYGDGTKESYTMVEGSMLQINEGDLHVIAKVKSGTKDELELEVTRFTVTHDTIKKAHTVQKTGTNTNKLAMTKSALLDPAGGVQVQPQSMALVNTGNQPKGACKGICCEAKCYSTWCCSDPDECKNVPCDCKPPSNCGPQPDVVAAQFFELFNSGKDVMVFMN